MSDKIVPTAPNLPEKPEKIGETEIFPGSTFELVQINRHHHLHDMTPVAAEAHKEMTRLRYAVPAEEATKQAVEATAQALQVTEQAKENTTRVVRRAEEDTKRHWFQYGSTGVCVLAAFFTLHLLPDAGPAIVGIITVMGAGQVLSKWVEKKKSGE